MNAHINVPAVLAAMKKKNWNVAATSAFCSVSNKTLKKVLDGQIPHRLDALYRLINGLDITIDEAILNGAAHKTELRVIAGGKAWPGTKGN